MDTKIFYIKTPDSAEIIKAELQVKGNDSRLKYNLDGEIKFDVLKDDVEPIYIRKKKFMGWVTERCYIKARSNFLNISQNEFKVASGITQDDLNLRSERETIRSLVAGIVAGDSLNENINHIKLLLFGLLLLGGLYLLMQGDFMGSIGLGGFF